MAELSREMAQVIAVRMRAMLRHEAAGLAEMGEREAFWRGVLATARAIQAINLACYCPGLAEIAEAELAELAGAKHAG